MKQPQPNLLLQLLPDDPAHALRNVADRYGVDPTGILHLAPVLFHVVAQLSLADRRDALKRRADAYSAMSGDGESFLVHSAGMFPEDRFEEAQGAELISLAAEDVLGAQIADESGDLSDSATGPENERFASVNPLVRFLAARCEGLVSDLRVTATDASFKTASHQPAGMIRKQDGGAR